VAAEPEPGLTAVSGQPQEPAQPDDHRWSGRPGAVAKTLVLSSKAAARVRPTGWMLYDALAAVGALIVGYGLTPRAQGLFPSTLGLVAFAFFVIAAGNISGLYDKQIVLSRIKLVLSLFTTAVLAIVGLALFTNLVEFERIGRWILLISAAVFFVTAAMPRLVAQYAAHLYKVRVLLVGNRDSLSPVARRLTDNEGYHVLVGYCSDEETGREEALGSIQDIPHLCRDLQIDEIIIADGYLDRADVLDRCLEAMPAGCRVMDEASFFEEVFEEVPVSHIREGWFFAAKLGGADPFYVGLKRLLDILAAAVCMVVLAPVFVILWALVRLTSPGPALYVQIRTGRFGKSFKMYKLRSMYVDAEANGARWAEANDPRITPVGRFLRKIRLDEIPQFWNVLKGDMSFVGPRPERPEMVAEIEKSVPYYAFRHLVRPGLTGLAQVRYQYGSSVQDARKKLQHDLYYIKNWSLLLDVQIFLRTISAVMKGSR